ncbi:fibronectin type III domain-containing protein [Flavobacterium sp. SM2513]|uniref:T9SS type A sorting domain-containing protein n=1 Tax=Flavobacterium sp. SM2513 TaxID=3424766 RepID=UPI003D7F1977
MKKITLSLVFLLTMVIGSYGQVAYDYDWESTTVPLGDWTTSSSYGFSRTTTTPCEGLASARANTYSSATSTLTSPLLPNSNGGLVTVNFDYKVTLFSPNTTGAAANQVEIELQASNSLSGPWFAVDYINENNHIVSANCAAKTATFSALPGNLYVRFLTKSLNGADVYYYFDNISITQGAAPSCIPPAFITVSEITSNSASINWTATSPAPSAGYEYYYSTSDVAPTTGTASTLLTAGLTSLQDNTIYYVWVKSTCDSGSSAWNGPVSFRTLCLPFGNFEENFETATVGSGLVPNCWNKLVVSTDTSANVSVINYAASSAPNAIYLTNANDATAQIYLITPALNAIGANTHRMKFEARGGVTGQILTVGTMSNPNDASTYVELQTYTLSTTYTTYNITLNTSTTAGFIAFKNGLGGTNRSVYLDNMTWEPIPAEAPGCIQDMNTVTHEGCGNYPTTFTWAAVSGADGYKVSIGTSINGQDLVVDELNIYNALNYSFVGNPGTTYYYTIRPYNASLNGNAVGCFEDSFTTYGDGCYCNSVPTQNDGAGITNVQINDYATLVTDITYADFTGAGAIDITQGINTVMNITLATGYSYWTDIWIDYNDDYNFDPSEVVYSSTVGSSSSSPTVVNTAFMTPLTAQIGEHRMRIISSDGKKIPANPCYSGDYAVSLDFLVNVVGAPDCLPPTASTVSNIVADGAQLTWVSAGTLFNVETVFAGEAQGSGILTSGITTNTVTVTDLDPQTNYVYYIQADCGEGSVSPWAGPFAFRTGCESFGSFTENFTTDVNYVAPECWYTLKNTTSTSAGINVYNNNDYVYFNNSDDAAAQLYLITPALTDLPLNTHRIKFKSYSIAVGATLQVGTMNNPNDASTFNLVQTIPLTATNANYSVSFINSTTDSHVAFKFMGTQVNQTLYIDDVIWETAPTCPDVYTLNFSGATTTTATISWTAGGTETAWQYAYGAADLPDPSGLTTYDVIATPSTTITGLAANTNYKVWVRSSCGTNFGEWSPAKTFLTECNAIITFPWTEGFESTTGSAFPPCWFKENGEWVTSAANEFVIPRTGSRFLRDTYYATDEYMWTPGFELTAGVSYDFSFYMAGDGYAGWTVGVYQNTVQNSVGATQLGTTINASGIGTTYEIQPYAKVTNTIVPTTSGTYYFAVKVNQPGYPWYIGFDDFRLEPTPTCIAPLSPTATNVTVNSATMNWTPTNPVPANGYDYYITSSDVLPNSTTVSTGTVMMGITTAGVTGLLANTVYKIYVRSICGTDDYSAWSDAGTFTTPCDSYTAPFAQNFDTYVPSCWATAAEGTVATGPTGSAAGIWTVDGFLNIGTTGAVKVNLYSTNRIGWLITPSMNTTIGNDYTFSFNYGTTIWNQTTLATMGSDDFVKVVMSVDNGVSWTEIHSFTAASNVLNTSQVYNYEFVASAVKAKFALIASDGTVDDGLDYDFFVDNIAFDSVLSNVDFDTNSFVAFPNPVKDVLNVSFNQNISVVTIYNLLGQQVLLMNINTNKGQVNMSSLATGTYLVKVNTENGVKTIKVVKE